MADPLVLPVWNEDAAPETPPTSNTFLLKQQRFFGSQLIRSQGETDDLFVVNSNSSPQKRRMCASHAPFIRLGYLRLINQVSRSSYAESIKLTLCRRQEGFGFHETLDNHEPTVQ
jgi:hypothetical protein